ncbi:MAG TPA: caspase family protein [Leptolyngbyaceae cyanobacterium M33_DOE_097]|uniref:Uncharacterized protein n=1 Tax=Oscillatoriales cyanobacterium SpSt-418 TaxID=2282169 RepID=A0A7C3PIW4_9CYAN|nr:caspase family protein [Leptolyngbyaceae cyanobacterium M33_DOE_097]
MSRDALIVGVSTYQYLPGLNAPAYDAEAIAQCLHQHGDFRVTRMPDTIQAGVSRVGQRTPVLLADLEAALVRLFKPKGKNIPQTALFYFSGHGLQKDAGIQEGYLATSDANPDAGVYGLSLFWLRRLLQESPVKQRILLLDCCHSGELLNFLEADPGACAGTDRLFMAASREYEAAYESINGQYSVFTKALLEGLDPAHSHTGEVTNYALSDWVSTALKGEMQQPLFENSGSEILLTRNQGVAQPIKTELLPEVCPYRGLEYFDEAHADYFFGRENLTDQLIEKLRSHNFLAILGASGSGKTSVVRAGLIHKLHQGHAFSGSNRWRVQIITPTEQPLKSLATAFVNPTSSAVERAEQLRRAETMLREGTSGLSYLTRASLQASQDQHLLLIIDQFEELFTLCQGTHAERDRVRFINILINALKEAKDVLTVVIVLRADFFGKCSHYHGLVEQIEQSLVTITPLTYEQIKASIVKPAQKVGLVCESNLVYNILMDIVGAPGELPLLQYTLLELWRKRQVNPTDGTTRLTLDAYTELGGVRGTLQKRADEIFFSLSPEEQLVAKRIFIALTQLGEGTEDTRRRILKSELVSSRFSAELIEQVLEKLVAAKLVVTNRISLASSHREHIDQGFANMSTALRLAQWSRGKTPSQTSGSLFYRAQTVVDIDRDRTIENLTRKPMEELAALPIPLLTRARFQETVDVAHEALIRNWSLLRQWLDENRELLWRQRRIERNAWEWSSAGQPASPEYLLTGDRLLEARTFFESYPDDLSTTAQQFVTTSLEEAQRQQRQTRLLQFSVPGALLSALLLTLFQYQVVVKSQAEKDFQTHLALSRQRAAIAQAILQEPAGDPAAALVISRLAIEQGEKSFEAQASLRAVLQKLRLQKELSGHQGRIQQIAFDPAGDQFATTATDGGIQLWSAKRQILKRTIASAPNAAPSHDRGYRQLGFAADGTYLAAIAPNRQSASVWSTETGEAILQLAGFQKSISHLRWSQQGTWVAAVGEDNLLQVWEAQSKRRQLIYRFRQPVRAIAFTPANSTLAIATETTVQIWSLTIQKPIASWNQAATVSQIAYSPDGKLLAVASDNHTVRLLDAASGKVLRTFALPKRVTPRVSLKHLQFSPNGQWLLTADASDRLQVWQVSTGQLQIDLGETAQADPQTLAFSPDGRRLVTLSRDPAEASMEIWDLEQGQIVERLEREMSPLTAAQFSQDGSLIVTGNAQGETQLWAAESGGELPTLNLGETGTELAIAYAGGLLTLNQKGGLQTWGLPVTANAPQAIAANNASPSLHKTVKQFFAQMGHQLSWFLDQQGLAFLSPSLPMSSSAIDRQFTETPLEPLRIQSTNFCSADLLARSSQASVLPELPEAMMLSQDGSFAATVTSQGLILWQVNADLTLEPLNCMEPPKAGVEALQNLVFDPTNRYLLGNLGDRVVVWQLATGRLSTTLSGHTQPVTDAQFSPDGNEIATVSQDDTLRFWRTTSSESLRIVRYSYPLVSVRYNPDGQSLALASTTGATHVIDSEGTPLVLLTGHRGGVLSVNFSPKGDSIVTTGSDGTVRLWNAQNGREWTTLRLEDESNSEVFQRAFFSNDGRYVIATTKEKVFIWAANWEGLLDLARDRTFRQLKPEECLRYLGMLPDACPNLSTGV